MVMVRYPRWASCTPEAAGLHGVERLSATVALLFLSSVGLALGSRGQGKGGIFVIFIFRMGGGSPSVTPIKVDGRAPRFRH